MAGFNTKKIMIDNGSDFPVEFYIELYKRYPCTTLFWEKVDINFVIKDGKYYNTLDPYTIFSFVEVYYGCDCLYSTYEYNERENIFRDLDIFFIDKFEQKTFTTKCIKEYLANPCCINLCEELGLDFIHEIPSYIDNIKYDKRLCKYVANIDKNKIIDNLLEIIRGSKEKANFADYSATGILCNGEISKIWINDIEKDLEKFIRKMNKSKQ